MSKVNQKRMLAEFFELVKIKSSTRAERDVADLLRDRLVGLGLDVMEDGCGSMIGGNCGNLIAYLPGKEPQAPVLLLSAHMDCVEPCGNIEPMLKAGLITSSGNTILGADDKAGIVGILEALRVLAEDGISHGDIQVVFTVAEEGGLSGAKHIDQSLLKGKLGYALDSGGAPGEIIIMAPGQNSLKVVFHGKTAHAGVAPEEGINAIVVAGKALAELKQGRIDSETTANVGIISGGHATNIVPDRVEILCEARSRSRNKLAEQTTDMCETFTRVAKECGARAEISVNKAYDAYSLSPEAPVVTLGMKAAEDIGLTPVLGATGGGSDANYFNAYGVPTAVLGVGMSKVHTNEEYIKEADLYNTAEFIVAIIKRAASIS